MTAPSIAEAPGPAAAADADGPTIVRLAKTRTPWKADDVVAKLKRWGLAPTARELREAAAAADLPPPARSAPRLRVVSAQPPEPEPEPAPETTRETTTSAYEPVPAPHELDLEAEAALERAAPPPSARFVPEPDARPLTREQRRSRRHREVRAKTISVKRMPKRVLELGRILYPDADHQRPTTRAECVDGPRPCPYVSCAHHLFLDVSAKTGAIKLNFPDLDPDELQESCALDVADRGGVSLEEVGAIMNVTRERIRQLEVRALDRMQGNGGHLLRELVTEGDGKRRLPLLAAVAGDEDDDGLDDEDLDDGDNDKLHLTVLSPTAAS